MYFRGLAQAVELVPGYKSNPLPEGEGADLGMLQILFDLRLRL